MSELWNTGVGAVSLLGVGPMGAPIARNILATGVPLTLWNRTESKAREITGAVVAKSPRDAAAHVVLTVLPDLPQVAALLEGDDGLLAGWAAAGIEHPVLVVHGTVSPVAVAAFAHRCLQDHGVTVLDAPLSGGTIGAEEARLSIMVGGDAEVAQRLRPLFEIYGATVVYFGPSGSGELAKVCNQIVVAATVSALAEAMALAESSGLDLAALQTVLAGGLANSEVLRQKGKRWIDKDFEGGGSAANQLKDLRFVAEAATAAHIALPISTTVKALFEEMVEAGDGPLDHTGVYRTIRAREG